MEKRFTLALVLCFIIVFVGMNFMAPPPQKPALPSSVIPGAGENTGTPGTGATGGGATGGGAVTQGGLAPTVAGVAGQESLAPAPVQFAEKSWTWRNDVVELDLSTRGAALSRIVLHTHKEDGRDEPLTLVYQEPESPGTLALDLGEDKRYLAEVNWDIDSEREREVVFRYPLADGSTVRKTIRLPEQGYFLECAVSFEGAWAPDSYYRLFGPSRLRQDGGARGTANSRITAYATPYRALSEVGRQAVAAIPEQVPHYYRDPTDTIWFGLESNYFACVIRPLDDWDGAPWKVIARQPRGQEKKQPHLQAFPLAVGCERLLRAGATHRYEVFLAPKDRNLISSHKTEGYDRLVDYGRLGFLVWLFLGLLNFFESFTASYGIAIILLTFVVKLILHPINRKNQAIMMEQQKQMAKIQPQLQEIKERYKGDPMKVNREMQKLWHEHGVNPMRMFGGCLLMFVQLPIWIGLINTFSLALELRHRSFLWVADLTQPDRLFELPFTVPYLEWQHFNILPILYVIVTIISQKMMPKPADPQMQQQQKIMTFMMAMFGFIFYNFSAGLLIYFLTSALLGIVEQKIIKRELALKEQRLAVARPAAARVG